MLNKIKSHAIENIAEKFAEYCERYAISRHALPYYKQEYNDILDAFDSKAEDIQIATNEKLEAVILGDMDEVFQICEEARDAFDNAIDEAIEALSDLFNRDNTEMVQLYYFND